MMAALFLVILVISLLLVIYIWRKKRITSNIKVRYIHIIVIKNVSVNYSRQLYHL